VVTKDYGSTVENPDHRLAGKSADSIMKTSALRKSADNLTVVFIAFQHFYEELERVKGDIHKVEPETIQISMIDIVQPPEK
jgi:hypothetical protein